MTGGDPATPGQDPGAERGWDPDRWLLDRELFGIRPGLDRMRALLARLGDPQRDFDAVHVVGSNGKTSTVTFAAALLRRRGLRVGAYVSPHLVRYAERIQLDGAPLGQDAFAAVVADVRDAAAAVEAAGEGGADAEDPVTQFEAITAAALLAFARTGVDCAVIEAGLVTPRDGTLTQECLAGVIALRVEEGDRIFARAPRPDVRPVQIDLARLAAAAGVALEATPAPALVDVGPVWLVAQASSVDALAAARPDLAAVEVVSAEVGAIGLTVFAIASEAGARERVRIRTWAPGAGVPEDPACGSCNAALGGYLAATGLLARTGRSYVVSQGRELGRDARIAVAVHGPDHVEIGGHAITTIEGVIRLD